MNPVRLQTVLLYLAALWLAVAASSAQTNPVAASTSTRPGSIAGTVTDQTGAVLPDSTVTVRDAAGVTQTATTNERGDYAFKKLPVSTYSITVSAPKFKDFHADGIILSSGQDIPMDAVLEPAGETTSINVEGQKISQVETETSEIVGNITQKELVSLGLNGRNFTQLIALTPGVSNQTGQDEAKVGPVGSVRYSVCLLYTSPSPRDA